MQYTIQLPAISPNGVMTTIKLAFGPRFLGQRCTLQRETCGLSTPSPQYWELPIATHELGSSEKEAFLEGYGMSPAQFEKVIPFVRMLNLLNYLHAVRLAVAKNREQLAWLRLRRAARLELYEP